MSEVEGPSRMRLMLTRIFSPPTIGVCLGLLVGMTPLRRGFFNDDDDDEDRIPPVGFLAALCRQIGGATVPSAMIVLGSNLAKGPSASQLQVPDFLKTISLRILIMPAVGFGFVVALIAMGAIDRDDDLLVFTAMLVGVGPTATVLTLVAIAHGYMAVEISALVFWQYVGAIATISAYVVLFLLYATQSF